MFIRLFILSLLFPFIIACAQESTMSEEATAITTAWTETINSGDVDGWVALHAPDIEFADYSYWQGNSQDELRVWGEAVVNAEGQYTILESSVQEDGTLLWVIDYKDRGFAIQGEAVVTLEDGVIQRLMIGNPE